MALPKPTHRSQDGRYLIFKNQKGGYRVFDTREKKQHHFDKLAKAKEIVEHWYLQEHMTPEQKRAYERTLDAAQHEAKRRMADYMNQELNKLTNI